MKNKPLIMCAITVLTLFMIGACKKYEENPLINLRSKTQRLIGNQSYSVVLFSVNGVDSLSNITNTKDITFHEVEGENIIANGFIRGSWAFDDHKKNLKIHMINNAAYHYGYGPFLSYQVLDWRITKLTDRELHLKINFNGKEYIIHLSKDKF